MYKCHFIEHLINKTRLFLGSNDGNLYTHLFSDLNIEQEDELILVETILRKG